MRELKEQEHELVQKLVMVEHQLEVVVMKYELDGESEEVKVLRLLMVLKEEL